MRTKADPMEVRREKIYGNLSGNVSLKGKTGIEISHTDLYTKQVLLGNGEFGVPHLSTMLVRLPPAIAMPW